MLQRISELHIGDMVRVYTYAGTSVRTHSSHVHTVTENRFDGNIFTELENKDGLRFMGIYLGEKDLSNTHSSYDNSQPEPYLLFQVLSQNFGRGHPSDLDKNEPDLRILTRLVRRFDILEPSFKSEAHSLEEVAEERVA